jgi:hypothetical protein
MATNRYQAPETPEAPALRPGGIPDSTFVTPAQDPLLRISSALGELKPALAQFGAAYYATTQKRQEEENTKNALLKSTPELREGLKSIGPAPVGSLPPTSSGAIESKLYGQRVAQDLQNDIVVRAQSGQIDWATTDVQKLVFDEMQKKLQGEFPDNHFAQSGFAGSMNGFAAKLQDLRDKHVVQEDQQLRQDNTFAGIAQAHTQASLDGKSPEEKAQAVFSAVNALAGPNGSQKVDFPVANKYVLDFARRLVSEGKVEDAIAILTAERTRSDGTKLPPLLQTAAHGAEVASILHSALVERRKQANLAAVQAITSNDAGMIAGENGRLATVGDIVLKKEDGTPHVISAAERQKAAVREYTQNVSPAIAAANHESPPQTFDRELSNLANAGAEHPQWKAILESAPKAASLNELTNPQKRDALLASAALYDQLREKNSGYLKQLVETPTRDFFEAYRVARRLPGKSMEEALDDARRASVDISPDREDILKGHYRTIEQQVSTADPRTWWQWLKPGFLGGEPAPVNAGHIQGEIIKTARLFARLGLSPDHAVKEAQTAIRETSQIVNGWVIPKFDVKTPGDFPEVARQYFDTFVSQYGKLNGGVGRSDVGVSYDGGGVFTLVDPNGLPLRDDKGVRHFTLKDLYAEHAARDDVIRQQALDTANAINTAKAAPKEAVRLSHEKGARADIDTALSEIGRIPARLKEFMDGLGVSGPTAQSMNTRRQQQRQQGAY